jgi:hypothetical protein
MSEPLPEAGDTWESRGRDPRTVRVIYIDDFGYAQVDRNTSRRKQGIRTDTLRKGYRLRSRDGRRSVCCDAAVDPHHLNCGRCGGPGVEAPIVVAKRDPDRRRELGDDG